MFLWMGKEMGSRILHMLEPGHLGFGVGTIEKGFAISRAKEDKLWRW